MKIRTYDRSGVLLNGYFFALRIPFDTDLELRTSADAAKWIVHDLALKAPDDDAWVEVCVNAQFEHGCALDRTHVTRSMITNVSWTDLHGGDHVTEFVRDSVGESIVVINDFADRLLASRLTGVGTMAVPIRVNQSRLTPCPKLWRLVFHGHGCIRRMRVCLPQPNLCPRCHAGPVVCPACGEIVYTCPHCGMNLVGVDDSGRDSPFTVEAFAESDAIVEGHEWDGGDFIAGGIISRRVLNYLENACAAPFVAKPCTVNVEQMTDRQLKWLRAM